MYVTQFGPVTNKVWLDWLEQAYGPQEHRDCGTLGKYHGSFMWSISVVHSGRFNNLTLTIFFPQQGLDLAVREFQDNADMAWQGAGSTRPIQWNGLRYMLTEVRPPPPTTLFPSSSPPPRDLRK